MSEQQNRDEEIRAIENVIAALEPLDSDARSRVIEYVFRRLKLTPYVARVDQNAESTAQMRPVVPSDGARETPHGRLVDIQALTREKRPSSQVEMVVLVAYYLAELADEKERKTEIDSADIAKYFKQAQYPLPKIPAQALVTAKGAGYLDQASRGKYILNPVGHNLVAHRLPSNASVLASSAKTPRSKAKTKAARPEKRAEKPRKRGNSRTR